MKCFTLISLPFPIKYKICEYLDRNLDLYTLIGISRLSPDWMVAVEYYSTECIKNGELPSLKYSNYSLAANVNLHHYDIATKKVVLKKISENLADHYGLMMRYFPNLKEVEIELDRDGARELVSFLQLEHHKSIEKLIVDVDDYHIGDRIFESRHFINLKILEIGLFESYLTLFDILDNFPNLESLYFTTDYDCEDLGLDNLLDFPAYYNRVYPKLRSINFYTHILNDIQSYHIECFKHLKVMLPNIESLELGAENIQPGLRSDAIIQKYNLYQTIVEGFKNLRSLELALINVFIVDAVNQNCPNLERLSLNLSHIIDPLDFVFTLQKLIGLSSMPNLKSLHISPSFYNKEAIWNESLFVKIEAYSNDTNLYPNNVTEVCQTNIKYMSFTRIGFSTRIFYFLEKFPLLEKLDIEMLNFFDIEDVAMSVSLKSVIVLSIKVWLYYTIRDIIKFIGIFPNVRVVKFHQISEPYFRVIKNVFPHIAFSYSKLKNETFEMHTPALGCLF